MVFMDRNKIKKLERIGWKKTKEKDLPFVPAYLRQFACERPWGDSYMRMYESEFTHIPFSDSPFSKRQRGYYM
jgi:hypothetical protein